jgi:hypothetical protein
MPSFTGIILSVHTLKLLQTVSSVATIFICSRQSKFMLRYGFGVVVASCEGDNGGGLMTPVVDDYANEGGCTLQPKYVSTLTGRREEILRHDRIGGIRIVPSLPKTPRCEQIMSVNQFSRWTLDAGRFPVKKFHREGRRSEMGPFVCPKCFRLRSRR